MRECLNTKEYKIERILFNIVGIPLDAGGCHDYKNFSTLRSYEIIYSFQAKPNL